MIFEDHCYACSRPNRRWHTQGCGECWHTWSKPGLVWHDWRVRARLWLRGPWREPMWETLPNRRAPRLRKALAELRPVLPRRPSKILVCPCCAHDF